MSVMACDRRGCRNVMCDRLSDQYQAYLCDSCFEELVNQGIHISIIDFLNSEPQSDSRDAVYAYYDAIFRKMQH